MKIYINGKEFDSYEENEITEIFSKIKHKITDAFSHEKDNDKHSNEEIQYSHDIEIIHHKNDPNTENQNNSNEKLVSISMTRIITILKEKKMLYHYGARK